MKKIFPCIYLITPDPEESSSLEIFLSQLVKSLSSGVKIIQLQSNMIDEERYQIIAWGVKLLCLSYDALLILNGPASAKALSFCDGLHLDNKKLLTHIKRPIKSNKLLSATCHNIEQLRHAEKIGVDIVTLPPSKEKTFNKIDQPTIDWNAFSELALLTEIPIFALGELSISDLTTAQKYGAYGLAGMRNFWNIEAMMEATKILLH